MCRHMLVMRSASAIGSAQALLGTRSDATYRFAFLGRGTFTLCLFSNRCGMR